MIKKNLYFFCVFCIFSLCSSSMFSVVEKTAADYFYTAREKYLKDDLSGAVEDIKKAKESGKDDKELNTLQKNLAVAYFNRGSEKYTANDLFGAVSDLEASMELYNLTTTKDILGLCLSEIVYVFYTKKKDYEKAIPYIEKLIKLFPGDPEYKEMYETAKKYTIRGVEALPGITPKKETQQIERLFALMESRLQRQEKLLETYDQKQKEQMQKILARAEAQTEKALKEISANIQKERNKTTRTFFFTTTSGVTVAGCIVMFLFLVMLKLFFRKKTAVILMSDEPRKQVLETLREKIQSLSSPGNEQPPSRREIDKLKIIEAEIVEHQTDPQAAEKILESFLQSEDNILKTKAAKALFKHNPVRALDILLEMLQDIHINTRIESVHTLGEISSPEAIKILIDNLDSADNDPVMTDASRDQLKKAIIKSLREIIENPRKELLPYLKEKIEKCLAKYEDTWIIE